MTHHVRNPIKWHGEKPTSHFTIIPNELARDAALSSYGYRIAVVIRTHAEGYEVSCASLAAMHRWGRGRTGKALEELIAARWLAKRTYETVDGNRIYDEYHVHESRRFSEEESAELNQRVVITAGPGPNENSIMSPSDTPGCAEQHHPDGARRDIKENQQEDQPENKEENHPTDCWICEGSGWSDGRRCENCFPQSHTRVLTNRESVHSAASCAGCKIFGAEGCFKHTTALFGRQHQPANDFNLVEA